MIPFDGQRMWIVFIFMSQVEKKMIDMMIRNATSMVNYNFHESWKVFDRFIIVLFTD